MRTENKVAELVKAVNDHANDTALRRTALQLAIQTARKVPYGPPGEAKMLALASSYLKFLRGEC